MAEQDDRSRGRPRLTRHLAAAMCVLGLSACKYVGDPWSGNDAQWKREHFATHEPQQALYWRLLRTQSDR
jgi:hypothetical protein